MKGRQDSWNLAGCELPKSRGWPMSWERFACVPESLGVDVNLTPKSRITQRNRTRRRDG